MIKLSAISCRCLDAREESVVSVTSIIATSACVMYLFRQPGDVMIILSLIFSLLVILLLWIIFVPVFLKINSGSQEYYLRQAGTFCLKLVPANQYSMELRIFGIPVSLKPASTKQIEQPRVKAKKPGIFRKKSYDAWLFFMRGMLRSIKVKELIIKADLNDVVLNAQLIPLTLLATRGVVQVSLNFNQTYYLSLLMEARINKMLWTFIRFSTKK